MRFFIDTGSVAEAEETAGGGVLSGATTSRALRTISEHIVVKVPFSPAGLAATRELVADGHPVNMTLVFSANQALLSAAAGATYISCFMGRLDDISVDSAAVVKEIVDTLRPGGYPQAQVLAASLRHPEHLKTAA